MAVPVPLLRVGDEPMRMVMIMGVIVVMPVRVGMAV
jgi:hypothetical protein